MDLLVHEDFSTLLRTCIYEHKHVCVHFVALLSDSLSLTGVLSNLHRWPHFCDKEDKLLLDTRETLWIYHGGQWKSASTLSESDCFPFPLSHVVYTHISQRIFFLPTRCLSLLSRFETWISWQPPRRQRLRVRVNGFKRAREWFVHQDVAAVGFFFFWCSAVCVCNSIQHAVSSQYIQCWGPVRCQNRCMFNVQAGPNYSAPIAVPRDVKEAPLDAG